VCFKATATGLFVAVIDSGARLDPRRLPEVDLQRYASEGRKGGLGVHLMGRIMDAVAFRRVTGRNVCSLFKRKSGSPEVGG
jgi:anti-sigma regulatory factor (Ser/Thr protein kinase)